MTDAELLASISSMGGCDPKRETRDGMEILSFLHYGSVRNFGVTGSPNVNDALYNAAVHECFSVRIPFDAAIA